MAVAPPPVEMLFSQRVRCSQDHLLISAVSVSWRSVIFFGVSVFKLWFWFHFLGGKSKKKAKQKKMTSLFFSHSSLNPNQPEMIMTWKEVAKTLSVYYEQTRESIANTIRHAVITSKFLSYNIQHNTHPKALKAFWSLHMLGILSHVFLSGSSSLCEWLWSLFLSKNELASFWSSPHVKFQDTFTLIADTLPRSQERYLDRTKGQRGSEIPAKVYQLLSLMSKSLFWIFPSGLRLCEPDYGSERSPLKQQCCHFSLASGQFGAY